MTLVWPRTVSGPLSYEQLAAYGSEGYLIVGGVFDDVEVAMMRRAFERLRTLSHELDASGMYRGAQFVLGDRPDGTGLGRAIQRVVWCAAADPVLDRLGRDPRLVHMAAQILGSSAMDQLISQAHFKDPSDGVHFPWHQDSRHRRFGTELWSDVNGTGSFVEIVTAIDPMTSDNGPLRVIPGSHRHGHLATDPATERFLPSNEAWFDAHDAIDIALEPGDVALFGPYLIHGSEPNRSERGRRTFLNGFAHPGANRRDYPGEGSGRTLSI